MGHSRVRVWVTFVLAVSATFAFAGAVPAAGPSVVKGQEVRTVYTADLGIGRPSGIGYSASGASLVVRSQTRTGTSISQVGFDENLLGTTELGRLEARAAETTNSLSAYNPGDGLTYTLGGGGASISGSNSGGVQVVADLSSVSLSDPTGITFAPSSDPTDPAGAYNLFIADAGTGSSSGSIVEVSLAATVALTATVDTATLVRDTLTSLWSPASPDPSGVAWVPGADQLIVVDSEVDEVTGAGWHNVNMWRTNRAGVVGGTGTMWGSTAALGGYSKEPTGAGYSPSLDTLFVSDDSAKKIWVIKRGPDNTFGTGDDIVTSVNAGAYGSTDTEDPELETTTGDLFYLDGVGREIYRINPVDGIFGNGNDVMTHFDISGLGPTDFEGLTSAPGKGTLYVGARTTKQIFEISLTGSLIRTISLSGVSGLKYISGLAVAPNSTGSGTMSLYVVDRAVDNGPDPNENDGRMFEVTAPDIGGIQTNQPPVANNDSAITSRDTSVDIDVLANDTDPNGDPLSIVSLTQPAQGSTGIVSGKVRYVPAAGWTGTTSFTYKASDGTLESGNATVTVTVTQPNQPPVAGNDSASTNEDTPVDIAVLANDTDPDGQSLTVQIVTQPANASVTVNANQTVRFVPAANWSGTTSFTYLAFDGIVTSNLATVTVVVNPVNDPPVAVDDSASTAIGVAIDIPVLANDTDPDGPSLSVVNLTQPATGAVSVNANNTVRYVPPANWAGTATFTYQVSDGSLTSNVATVTVSVRDPNGLFYAISENTVYGTKVNDYTATFAVDGATEQFTEQVYSRGTKDRMEHRWTFNLTPGSSIRFQMSATSTGEPIKISYSKDGGTKWSTLGTITSTNSAIDVSVPATLSGTIIVRAKHTVSADGFADTLAVDGLWFLVAA